MQSSRFILTFRLIIAMRNVWFDFMHCVVLSSVIRHFLSLIVRASTNPLRGDDAGTRLIRFPFLTVGWNVAICLVHYETVKAELQ